MKGATPMAATQSSDRLITRKVDEDVSFILELHNRRFLAVIRVCDD
jgi:hypothetical protein